MAHRFFVDPRQVKGETAKICGDDVQHILKVLRLKSGDEIALADGTGQEYLGKIDSLNKEEVIVKIYSQVSSISEPPVKVTLLQGIPKGDKMDFIIQKCTELGIARVIPVVTKRTIVQWNKDKAKTRQIRWQRIAEEAAKQSQRARIPVVEEVQTLEEALQIIGDQLLLIPWEEEKSTSLKRILKGQEREKGQELALLIGPEGGLAPEEVRAAKSQNAVTVTLGTRILRTETAGFAALTMILYDLGDLGGTRVGN